jgi:hypothetical protein
MKISAEHYEIVKKAILGVIKKYPDHKQGYIDAGLSMERWRWDMFHHCGLKVGDGVGVSGLPLYSYLHDSHIDTALRKITQTN